MRTLVAGVGNVFLGDDGFGVEVARKLMERDLPADVDVGDFGIRGLHLAYELLDGYGALVLIDALQRGEEPGTLTVLEVDSGDFGERTNVDAHGMSPDAVLAFLSKLGGSLDKVLVVGCEPAATNEEMGLSERVRVAVDPAVDMVVSLAEKLAAEVPTDRRELEKEGLV